MNKLRRFFKFSPQLIDCALSQGQNDLAVHLLAEMQEIRLKHKFYDNDSIAKFIAKMDEE